MTQNEVKELINESIARLDEFNNKAKSRINDLSCHEHYINQGRQLLFEIKRGKLFEDEKGRETEYESIMCVDEFKKLHCKISKAANIVSFLKGDISLEIFKQKENEVNSI